MSNLVRERPEPRWFSLVCMALTSGDAEYEKTISVEACGIEEAIDAALDRDPSVYHIVHLQRTVWSADGIDA